MWQYISHTVACNLNLAYWYSVSSSFKSVETVGNENDLPHFLKQKFVFFFFRCHFLGNMNNLMGSSITDTQEYVNIIIRNIIFINNMNSIRNNRTINNIGIEYACLFYDGIWGIFCMPWTSAGLVVVKMTLSAIQSSSVSWSIITNGLQWNGTDSIGT